MGKYKPKRTDVMYKHLNNFIVHTEHVEQGSKRYRMCLSKTGFDTEFEATIMAAKNGLREYKCDYCPHWHLTSMKG